MNKSRNKYISEVVTNIGHIVFASLVVMNSLSESIDILTLFIGIVLTLNLYLLGYFLIKENS